MYLPEMKQDVIWTVIGSPWGLLALWLAVINVVTFFVFGVDKLKAKYKEAHEKTRRIPEKTLFLLSGIGGSVGALLGMRVWRHKTQHKSFRFGIPAILVLQVVLVFSLWLYVYVIR